MKLLTVIGILLATFGLHLCGAQPGNAATLDEAVRLVAASNNAFAQDLYQQLQSTPGNLVFSPYSLLSALAMTSAGARHATKEQMMNVLHFNDVLEERHQAINAWGEALSNSSDEQRGYQFSQANAVWNQEGFEILAEFSEFLLSRYNARLTSLDFQGQSEEAAEIINAWVAEQTHGKIRDIIEAQLLRQGAALVLTNALYFKGAWQSPFDRQKTEDGAFTLNDGEQVEIPMMHQMTSLFYGEDEQLQIIELPYEAPQDAPGLSMFVVLPQEAGQFTKSENDLTIANIEELIANMHKQKVAVGLPRFTVQSSFSLPTQLQALGMTNAFALSLADFSGITDARDLYISEVRHKVILEVNEEGSEAAGASAVTMSRGFSRSAVFQADHPFWVLIRDRQTDGILFWGRIMDPRE